MRSYKVLSSHAVQRKRSVFLCGVIAIVANLGVAYAQTPPDAGALQRQIEQERRKALPEKAAPQLPLPQPLQSIGGSTVTVTAFHFAGNTLLTDKQLMSVTSAFLNRPLDFAGLQNAAIAVATAYRSAGWIVRVYLPQQDVTGGTVTIQIVEAKFGAVQIEGKPEHVSARRLQRMVESSQVSGTPVKADALDRALLLIDDLPGVSATGHLSEGQNLAETDLIVTAADAARTATSVYADNAGARSTGAARIVASSSLNSPFGFGDRVDAVLLHSQGSDYVRAAYSLPVGYRGWRVGANASHFGYSIVTSDFSALDAHGNSTSIGVESSYPLLRRRLSNLYLSFAADDKQFDNKSAGVTTTDYAVKSAGLTLYGNLFDKLIGGGATTASVSFVQGRVDLNGSPNQAVDALTTDTAGSYHKLLFTVTRQQALTERLSLFASVNGQRASKNLDSSEKLYLGGSTGVRAYPANEGGGSEGLLANIEGRMRLPSHFDLTGFFDWGSVTVNKDNDIIGAATPNTVILKGAGLSLGWTASYGLSLKATVAHRIGSNPNPTPNGYDQDGSLVKNRIWVLASFQF